MKDYKLQKELLGTDFNSFDSSKIDQQLELTNNSIKQWHDKICLYQSNLLKGHGLKHQQGSLFEDNSENSVTEFDPLLLTPLPLSFWWWPKAPHAGPAIYFVISTVNIEDKNILLYIGETVEADKRWKGNHDCKRYLSNYSENLQKAGIKYQLTIRFWVDVPKETKARQKIEQQLIQYWLPPFNKETRERWSTPFIS